MNQAPEKEVKPSYKHLVYSNASELQRLEELLTEIRKTKLGAELIRNAEEYGTKIFFDSDMRAYGSFCEVEKRVKLNSKNSKDRNIGTLSHELRHSQQFQNGILMDALKDTPKSYIQTQGVIEADACVAACDVCYELALLGNPAPLESLREKDAHIVNPFQAHAVEGPEAMPAARQAGFYGWFTDYSTRDAYDCNYLAMYNQLKRKASREDEAKRLEREVPVADTIAKVCNTDGKPYLGKEAEAFFAEKDASTISFERFNSIYSELYFKYDLDYKLSAEESMKQFGLYMRPHYGFMPSRVVPEVKPIPPLAQRQAMAAYKISETKNSKAEVGETKKDEKKAEPFVPELWKIKAAANKNQK